MCVCVDFTHKSVKLRSIIAETPARVFIKQIRCHVGHMTCNRCEVEGVYKDGSMSYEDCSNKTDTWNFLTLKQESHTLV